MSNMDLNNMHLPLFYAFGNILDEKQIKDSK